MQTQEQLAEQFEEHRDHLRGVAYRMLGSVAEADDAVQEALAPAGAHGHQRRGQPARLADDRGQPRSASTSSGPQVAARGVPRRPRPGPGRDPPRLRPRGRRGAGRRGDPGPARRPRRAEPARADGVRPARHVRRPVRRRSARSSGSSPATATQLASRARRRVRAAPPAGRRPGHPATGPRRLHVRRPARRLRGAPGRSSTPT